MLFSLFVVALAADPWPATIDRVLGSVVIIEMDRTRPFDGNAQSSSEASGFVIDAERGLVLTNRHVVTTGPTRAQAIFNNKEEVDLVPLYADPVHDFGLFQYDPSELTYIEPISLPLLPEGAAVGKEIRVIGNDAAEQLSILGGTLSRLDRAAPHWDFNTFYLQAASSTSGGSSGSPVFDEEGNVIALNAGARNDAATSLFLPLDRVVTAVKALQAGEVPSRGTVQAVLSYQTYDELRRLGLDADREREVRSAHTGTGMLTVGRVNDGGPADGHLEEGDIVLSVDGESLFTFVAWEARVDAAVGKSLAVSVLRGGEVVDTSVAVEDLHALTPSDYLEIGEGVLHPLGYHAAVRVPRPVQGVAVARAGRLFASAGIGTSAIIEGIGETPVVTLQDAIDALQEVPDGERVQVRWTQRSDPTNKRVSSVLMSRELWPVRHCARGDNGTWPCTPLDSPPPSDAPTRQSLRLAVEKKAKYRAAAQALVEVSFRPLLNLDSAHGNQRTSPGVLLNAEGLVLTDRNAVPMSLGQVRVRVGDAPSVPAKVLYMDPLHNVAFVQVDMDYLQLPPFEPPVLADLPMEVGDELMLVALDKKGSVYKQVVDLDRVVSASFGTPSYPRFLERDIDFVRLGSLDRPTRGGVLVDKKGRVVGLVQRYPKDDGNRHNTSLNTTTVHYALAALRRLKSGAEVVPTLGLDLWSRTLIDAREAGLPDAVASQIRAYAPERAQVLEITRLSGDSPARDVLEVGDWIIQAAGRPLTTYQELEDRVTDAPLQLQVVRRGEVVEITVEPMLLGVSGTQRALLWAGTLVQEEHPEVALYGQTPAAGVYLSWFYGGTPAQRYATGYGRRVLAVDGVEVNDLDSFLAAVEDKPDRSSVRLRMQDLKGDEWITTLKLDLQFWPTQQFVKQPEGWVREEL